MRHEGVYIGFFEWLVWRQISKSDVLMLFGSIVVDVGLDFGGSVPAVESTAAHRVIAVFMDGNKMLSVVIPGSPLPDVNHFVVGLPIPGNEGNKPNTTWPDLLAPADDYRRTAVAAAHLAGW